MIFFGKSYEEITEIIFDVPSDYSYKCVKMKIDNDIYISCFETVEFCFQYNRWYFFNKTCSQLGSGLVIS